MSVARGKYEKQPEVQRTRMSIRTTIMKQLQNNFTTPEQSKRLLELGVPADSADCYHNPFAGKPYLLTMPYSKTTWIYENNPPLPCWSVGRLIEIIMLCGISANHKVRPILDSDLYEIHDTLIEYLVQELEENAEDWYDFSKLDD